MISGQAAASCFPNVSQGDELQMYHHHLNDQASSSTTTETNSNSLLYSFSFLKDKINQAQSLLSILISSPADQHHQFHTPESTPLAVARISTIIQEIIIIASSMVFSCQQMAIASNSANGNADELHHADNKVQENALLQPNFGGEGGSNTGQDSRQSFFPSETFDWYGNNYNNSCSTNDVSNNNRGTLVISSGNNTLKSKELCKRVVEENVGEGELVVKNNDDIIELDASHLLAKYTHNCQLCGKGFKRDANLRMHMRAHGDEYKTSAALSNPIKQSASRGDNKYEPWSTKLPRKYSCPQEGCRWNQKHAKFQPLKSMICVKNHYKRSHCPKIYVCKRCNRKQFSVLSDLRTHEKHCGDLKWQCSCGTTFSRKDMLLGHVALFNGHTPAITTTNSLPMAAAKVEKQASQMQLDNRD